MRRMADFRTAGGLARLGIAAGLLLSAAAVSHHLWTASPPLDGHSLTLLAGRPMLAPSARADETIEPLPEKSLEFPVLALARVRLQDSFAERRGATRVHQALDIMAPRHTPVRAVADGAIVRLTASGAGGLAIYQIDHSGGYGFYYAHLEAYAPGLGEGRGARRGEVIGYVGSSGNAPESAPHLHFAVYRLLRRHQWAGGRPINPYPLFKARSDLFPSAANRIALGG